MLEISEEIVRRTADICGTNSGAAKALINAEQRRNAGEEVHFYRVGFAIIVQGKEPPHA